MKRKIIFLSVLALIHFACSGQQKTMAPVVQFDGPIQISSNDKEHLFASYHGINSWSRNQRYVTVLETTVRNRIPDLSDTATLALVDLKTGAFLPVAKTTAWNFQQGCMAHWLATNPDSVIIYNDCRNGKFVSVILNVHSRKEIKVYPFPIAAVSPNGKEAISINFARIRITRPDYGYDGPGQEANADIQFPEDDGIFLVDLRTGKSRLIVSYDQLKPLVPPIKEASGMEYIGHIVFSRLGSKLFFLARANPERNTVAFTVNRDGTNLQQCFPAGWDGSHFDWLNDDALLVTAKFNGKQWSHILFTPGQNDYKRLGGGLLDYDGHGTFSPDGRWLVTDTYPDANLREQKIFLMNMVTENILSLGRFPAPPEYTGGWRCDIHCRWSPKGNMIGFNSAHSGKRQVYIFKLKMQ